ncbi:MAG: acyl carrier protein [Acidobacteria bacterium]|nr:acyl carrier protein [Acidobacteriota bacterium]
MDKRTQILDIIRTVAGKDPSVAPDESLFDNGVLDSFGLQDLVTGLEKSFGVKIPDSDLTPRKFDSIERIEEYLQEHGK